MSRRKWARPLIAVGVLALAVFLLQRTFRSYDAADILKSVLAVSPARFVIICAFALGSYPGAGGPSTTGAIEDLSRVDGEPIEPLAGENDSAALGLVMGESERLHMPFRVNLAGSRDPLGLRRARRRSA